MVNAPMDMVARRAILAAAQRVDTGNMSILPVLRMLLAAALLALVCSAPSALAQARRALIIGVGEYTQLRSLEGVPQRDAEGFGRVFSGPLGFDDVTVLNDVTQTDFLIALSEFIDRTEEGDTVVFIFSGHGWSDGAENYLAFADAPATGTESSRKLRTVALSGAVLEQIQGRMPRAVIAIIDACRDNPFADQTKSLPKGLGRVQEREGVLVAFAAGQGQTALAKVPWDADGGYSLFTRHLLPRLANASRPLSRIFEDVRNEVQREAESVPHWQRPAIYSELPLDWCLGTSCETSLSEEGALWLTATRQAGTAEACTVYADYIARFPKGEYIAAATRLAALPPCAEAPSNWSYLASYQPTLLKQMAQPVYVCDDAHATVYFGYDRAVISQDGAASLDAFFGDNPGCRISRIVIEGHDDGTFINEDGNRISQEYSLRLSERRASSISAYLQAMGAPAEKIIIHAFGAARPAVPDGDPAFNRRVEVTVVYEAEVPDGLPG